MSANETLFDFERRQEPFPNLVYANQGNQRWYTQHAIQQRRRLLNHPEIETWIRPFWDALPRSSRTGNLSQDEYLMYHMAIAQALRRGLPQAPSLSLALNDWEQDMKHAAEPQAQEMNWIAFHRSVFQLVDQWTDSIEVDHYGRVLTPAKAPCSSLSKSQLHSVQYQETLFDSPRSKSPKKYSFLRSSVPKRPTSCGNLLGETKGEPVPTNHSSGLRFLSCAEIRPVPLDDLNAISARVGSEPAKRLLQESREVQKVLLERRGVSLEEYEARYEKMMKKENKMVIRSRVPRLESWRRTRRDSSGESDALDRFLNEKHGERDEKPSLKQRNSGSSSSFEGGNEEETNVESTASSSSPWNTKLSEAEKSRLRQIFGLTKEDAAAPPIPSSSPISRSHPQKHRSFRDPDVIRTSLSTLRNTNHRLRRLTAARVISLTPLHDSSAVPRVLSRHPGTIITHVPKRKPKPNLSSSTNDLHRTACDMQTADFAAFTRALQATIRQQHGVGQH